MVVHAERAESGSAVLLSHVKKTTRQSGSVICRRQAVSLEPNHQVIITILEPKGLVLAKSLLVVKSVIRLCRKKKKDSPLKKRNKESAAINKKFLPVSTVQPGECGEDPDIISR